MLPSRFLCLVQGPQEIGPALRYLSHIEEIRPTPIALLPWSGRDGQMVDETGVRHALDPQLAALLANLPMDVTWAKGDGDNWAEVAAELKPEDWLVLTLPTAELAEYRGTLHDYLRRCPVPVLVNPVEASSRVDDDGQEHQGIVVLYDAKAGAEQALLTGAGMAEEMDVPLQILSAFRADGVEALSEWVEDLLTPFELDWSMAVIPDGHESEVLRHLRQYPPALLILGIPGGGMGDTGGFGQEPDLHLLLELLAQEPVPILGIPEWGTIRVAEGGAPKKDQTKPSLTPNPNIKMIDTDA